MTFKELDKEIAEELGMERKQVMFVLREAEKAMFNRLLFGQEIQIHSIGKFELKITKGRKRHMLHLGKSVFQPANYRLNFKVSNAIRTKLKQKVVYDGSQTKS